MSSFFIGIDSLSDRSHFPNVNTCNHKPKAPVGKLEMEAMPLFSAGRVSSGSVHEGWSGFLLWILVVLLLKTALKSFSVALQGSEELVCSLTV